MKLHRKGLLAATVAAAAGLALTGGLIAASAASAATAGHSAVTAQGSSSAVYNTLSAAPGQGTSEGGVAGAPDPCPGPNPGGPHTGQGNVLGTIEYDVSSTTAPD